nr:hypothetical protein [Amylibacter sp.]
MPNPIVIPAEFGPGVPLSARELNELQKEILRQLYSHTHEGDENGPPLDTPAYQDRSVTAPKLADKAVEARAIAEGAIGAAHIADGAIGPNALADSAVETRHLKNGAVSEEKLSAQVQLMLRRTGDSASSASQVIWRDPIVVWEPIGTRPTIIDTFIDPELVYWLPPVIGLDPDDLPIQLNPKIIQVDGKPTLQPFETFGTSNPLKAENPELAFTLEDAIFSTTVEIETVGAFEVLSGGVEILRESGAIGGAGLSGAVAMPTAPAVAAVGAPAMMRMATHAPLSASAPAPMAPTAPTTATPHTAAPAAAPASTREPISIKLTEGGQMAAARMTSVGAVDINGKPVPAGSPDSFTVSSGFVGKQSFFAEGESVDFRDLGNQSERDRAAAAGKSMLYNLGIDAQYLDAVGGALSDDLRNNIQRAINGDAGFYRADNPMWGGTSWLPDILDRPDLFGSGYAISGGRNILDVTRQQVANAAAQTHYVRVRFIKPYQNSAYSVSVTPRLKFGFQMISGHIRNKSPGQCELTFKGLRANGSVVDVNNLSFDLAVFGKLAS